MNRRSLLAAMLAATAAPAFVRAGVLMPVRKIITPADFKWHELAMPPDDGGFAVGAAQIGRLYVDGRFYGNVTELRFTPTLENLKLERSR